MNKVGRVKAAINCVSSHLSIKLDFTNMLLPGSYLAAGILAASGLYEYY